MYLWGELEKKITKLTIAGIKPSLNVTGKKPFYKEILGCCRDVTLFFL